MKKQVGNIIGIYGTAILLLWIGIYKFTPTEVKDIFEVVNQSPFLNWMYKLFSMNLTSYIIGTIEIITSVLFFISPFYKKFNFLTGALGTLIFLITLSFLFTTSNMFTKVDGIWLTNFFILKDLVPLGISIQLMIESKKRNSDN